MDKRWEQSKPPGATPSDTAHPTRFEPDPDGSFDRQVSPVARLSTAAVCAAALFALVFTAWHGDGAEKPAQSAIAPATAQRASPDEDMMTAAAPSVTLDSSWAGVREATIRAAVEGVHGPAGTGLPGIAKIEYQPVGIPPMVEVYLELAGVNNPSWAALSDEQQHAYAQHVLDAIGRVLPTTSPTGARSEVVVKVRIFATVQRQEDIDVEDSAYQGCRQLTAGLDWCHETALSEETPIPLAAAPDPA